MLFTIMWTCGVLLSLYMKQTLPLSTQYLWRRVYRQFLLPPPLSSWQVVGLGVRGVFSIIQEVWQTMPSLCLRALREFLNILQGQSPAGLHSEPEETTGTSSLNLFPPFSDSVVCIHTL